MNAGTSDHLAQIQQFISNGNASNISYLPASAVTIVYDQGRNFNTVNGYVLPPIKAAIAAASARYSAYFQYQSARISNTTVANVIAAVAVANITHLPIDSTSINLHPAAPYASFLATSLGYLFLWLLTISLVSMAIRLTQPLAGKIRIIDIVFFRLFNTLFNGLIISLIYSLCVLWFSDFTHAVPFIRFWLFNWLAALTFTVIIGLFIMSFGALAQIALTLFLIINLSASTTNLAIELQNRFYRVGYGLPLYHCFNGGRHLLFGSYTSLNVDIGVLFAYYFGFVILTVSAGVYQMRKQQEQIIENNRKKLAKNNNNNINTKNIPNKK
jgi:hypothetical protein